MVSRPDCRGPGEGNRAGHLLPAPNSMLPAGAPWAAHESGPYWKCHKRLLQEEEGAERRAALRNRRHSLRGGCGGVSRFCRLFGFVNHFGVKPA